MRASIDTADSEEPNVPAATRRPAIGRDFELLLLTEKREEMFVFNFSDFSVQYFDSFSNISSKSFFLLLISFSL